MALDVGYLSALGAGALSFLSPCVLPLVPPYLCYMAGISVDQFRDGDQAENAAARRTVLHWERYRAPLQPFLRTLGEHALRLGYELAPPRD